MIKINTNLDLYRTLFTMRSFKRIVLGILVLCSITGLVSCDKNKASSANETSAQGFEIDKEYDRGAVTIHVKANREQITTADELTLQLEAIADADYEVEFPKPGDKLEELKIIDHDESMPTLTKDGKVLHSQSYQLEPFLAGDYKIPPMKITFWKKEKKEPEKQEFESEPFTIHVISVLPEKSGEARIKDLVPPMLIPGWDKKWFWITAVGIGILAICSAGGLLYRRYRNDEIQTEMSKLPAHEIAFQQLDKLLADRLIEQGQIKEFYIRISDILRHYIENRFSLNAPERTTEEFLMELRQSNVLTDSHKRLLKEFLSQCDLVKFAKFLPESDETHKTVDVSKQFIEETKITEKEETAQL
jgi:hypothetical protein